VVPMAINWGEAGLLAGRGFGAVFLMLIIIAVVTWLVGFIFQRIKKRQEKAKSAAEAETTKARN
jgi:Na+-transporting methylmalonyl-CoA/oxaloacetate decarboxylase gamma subunit